MRNILIAVVTSLLIAAPAAAQGTGWSGNFNLILGAKGMDNAEWGPWDEHAEAGFHLDFQPTGWLLSIAASVMGSESEQFLGTVVETTETWLGVRKIWPVGQHIRPYLGGGLAFITADATGFFVDSGDATGIWLGGGVYWTLGGHFNLGLDISASSAEATMDSGFKGDIGGGHAGLLLGYHF